MKSNEIMTLDIHTHHPAPQPNGVISVNPDDFNPVSGQLYSIGIHPWETRQGITEETRDKLANISSHAQVAAIGECGIDMIKGGPLFRQMQLLKRHIELSEEVGKPLVIHCVKAHDIIIGLKKDLKPTQLWAIHGFRGKPSVAKMLTDAGIMLSIGEFFNEETVEVMPMDRILVETDESSLSIEEVIAKLSAIRGADMTSVIESNTTRFLKGSVGR